MKNQPSVQVKRSLRDIDLSRFRVFISYKTEDRLFAEQVAIGLGNLGFNVGFLTPDSMATRIEHDELEEKLALHVFHADAVCLIVSQKSLQSPWVQFEFREAAQSIGRIVFVCNKEAWPAGDLLMAAINPSDFSQFLEVKHTTVFVSETGRGMKSLVDALINDHEVGWLDGRPGIEPFPLTRGIAFQLESIRRRFARTYIMTVNAYYGRKILDVIPFAWDEIECQPEDVLGAIRWAIFRCGRRKLAAALLQDQLEIFHDTMPFDIRHGAVIEMEMGPRPHQCGDDLEMLVICSKRGTGEKLGQLPNGRLAAAWSLRPPDLSVPEAIVKLTYPDRKIAGVVARFRRNRPTEEGLDLGEYGLEVLENDRRDLFDRFERGEIEYYVDTFQVPPDQNWLFTGAVFEKR